jgi:hypothetical protein
MPARAARASARPALRTLLGGTSDDPTLGGVRCFIEATLEHSQAPGASVGGAVVRCFIEASLDRGSASIGR